MLIKYDKTDEKKKYPYYEIQPSTFRRASLSDFYDGEKRLIMNKPYLIHSEVNPKRYWACRTKLGFMDMNDFMLFLEKGRVYVLRG